MPRNGPTRHLFVEDPEWSDPGSGLYACKVCRLSPGNAIHDLPEVTEEQRAHERRRIGETD